MPTYEYVCTSCAHEWEAEQSIKEAPLTACPSCSNSTARRQISRGTGFILKGGGWYSDLYASGSNKPPSKPEGGGSESKGSDSGSSGTSDAASGGSSTDGGSSTAKSGASPTTSAAA